MIGITTETLDSQSEVLYILLASSYTMITCLAVSLFCLAWDLTISGGRPAFKPFRILGPHLGSSPRSLIFGEYLLRRRYRYDLR